jgi:hypothetical protein
MTTLPVPRRRPGGGRLATGLVGSFVAAMFASAPAPATAQSQDACSHFVEELPVTITEPGIYCLQEDTLYSQLTAPVTIQSPDVTLDCRGHHIDGSPLPNDAGVYGIYADQNSDGLIVRNCFLRGFLFGVASYSPALIEDNVFRGPGAEAIYIEGDGTIVRRNRIVNYGNSKSGFKFAWGIVTFGDVDIVDNDIDGLIATPGGGQSVIGIVANDGYETTQTYVIRGNRIRGLQPDVGQPAYAISAGTTGQLVIRDNVIFGSDLTSSIGIYCWGAPDSHVAGNDLYDFPMSTYGCTPDAKNVVRD